MKAKLIKTENGYGLEGVQIIAFYSSKRPVHNHYKLSKQNCDEIFGVTDVEKLAEEYGSKFAHSYDPEDFIAGFNKAMELYQPTEIEVTFNPEEKDSEGCLILKRVV
jgi:thiamine pyrophosphate-dependent acetolactate synthase large subunit-like protein